MAAPTNAVRVADLVTQTVRGEPGGFVERLVQGWQDEALDWITNRALAVEDLLHPFRCPAVQGTDGRTLLDYMLWIYGFTDELSGIVADLTDLQKRQLAASAASLWKEKGRSSSWARVVLAVLDVPLWCVNYFDQRLLLDDPEHGTISGWPCPALMGDPRDLDLLARDPGDVTTRRLVADIVDLTRPTGARVRVRWYDVLETWDRLRSSRWDADGGSVVPTVVDGQLVMPGTGPINTEVLCIEKGVAWGNYVFQFRFSTDDATMGGFKFWVHYVDATHYISVVGSYFLGTVRLFYRNGAAPEALVATQPLAGYADVMYSIQITVADEGGGQQRVICRIDGDVAVEGSTLGPVAGYFGWRSLIGELTIDRPVVCYDLPLEHEWLAPNGAVDGEA